MDRLLPLAFLLAFVLFFFVGLGQALEQRELDSTTTTGKCARSVFETRVLFSEYLPEEAGSRLKDNPSRHPDRDICGSFANKESCCSSDTLDDLVAWSDAMDASVLLSRYAKKLVDKDPRLFYDQMLLTVRSYEASPDSLDWKKLRVNTRDEAGVFIKAAWDAMYPSLKDIWAAVITYEEGLLCSACEPDFARFLDNNGNLKVRSNAAYDIADKMVVAMGNFDSFMTKEKAAFQALLQNICNQVSTKCSFVSYGSGALVAYVTDLRLRQMLCGADTGDLNARNGVCREFVVMKMLRGLYVDYSVITANVFTFMTLKCPHNVGINCDAISGAKKSAMNMFYSFDDRPLATNIYGVDGFDVKTAACSSNLSGYACNGQGPSPEQHHSSAPAGNSGPIIITLVVLVTVSAVGAVIYISRHRILRVTQHFYTRIRDDGMGPTVGLV